MEADLSAVPKATKIFQDLSVRLSRVFPMKLRIREFDVEVYDINIGENPPLKACKIEVAGCLQNDMNVALLQYFQKRFQVIRIKGRLAAREGDASAGVLKKRYILQQILRQRLRLSIGPYESQRSPGADLGAFAAADALFPVNAKSEIAVGGSLRTDFGTFGAMDTGSRGEGDLWPGGLGFGVMAERATKGATLKKNHAAHSGPVFEALSLNIHDERHRSLPLFRPHYSLCCQRPVYPAT